MSIQGKSEKRAFCFKGARCSCNVSMPYYFTTVYLPLTAPADWLYPFCIICDFWNPLGIISLEDLKNNNINKFDIRQLRVMFDVHRTVRWSWFPAPAFLFPVCFTPAVRRSRLLTVQNLCRSWWQRCSATRRFWSVVLAWERKHGRSARHLNGKKSALLEVYPSSSGCSCDVKFSLRECVLFIPKLRFAEHQISWVTEWLSTRFFSMG